MIILKENFANRFESGREVGINMWGLRDEQLEEN